MAASVQFRPQNRDLGMVMREVDEDLAIFLGIQNAEKERNDRRLVDESDVFDSSKSAEAEVVCLLASNASQDNLLDLEMEKKDDNWLISQPDEQESTKIPDNEGVTLKSELENTCEVSAPLKPATSANERKPARRSATPMGRPSLPAKPKPSRPSTPTPRSTLPPSSKPVAAQPRSSTPVGPTPRSSTPNSRTSSIPVISKPTLRSNTPTRKPATPSTTSDRSSSGRKTGPVILKSSGSSRGVSPTVKSRPSKPLEMLSISHDTLQNPKISMPKRPVSASRGRVSAPTTRPSTSNERPRQRSCSPAKARAPLSAVPFKTGSRILPRSRDEVNPVVMGTKMVDRVVNMRKLAPPKQDEYATCHENGTRKSSSENSGFGRSLSKKSLDMAMRHMDIRRSINSEKSRSSSTLF